MLVSLQASRIRVLVNSPKTGRSASPRIEWLEAAPWIAGGRRSAGRDFGQAEVKGIRMRTIVLGYWVILVGAVLNIVGIVWDAVDDLTGEEALGGLLTPERLKLLGIAVVILGLVLGFRLGLRRRGE